MTHVQYTKKKTHDAWQRKFLFFFLQKSLYLAPIVPAKTPIESPALFDIPEEEEDGELTSVHGNSQSTEDQHKLTHRSTLTSQVLMSG